MIDLDRIEAGCDALINQGFGWSSPAYSSASSVKELITRLRQAEKDAARYRWLSNCYIGENSALGINRGGVSCQADFDSAIDEAMNGSNN